MHEETWIDVTVPLHDGMVGWPGDPPVALERLERAEGGSTVAVSQLKLGTHAGTHVDAPAHLIPGGATVDALPLSVAMGPARVVEIADPARVTREALQAVDPQPGERLLLRTRNSNLAAKHGPLVHLSLSAARFLAERKLALVGIDCLSVSPLDESPTAIHKALLDAGVWILEGLDLTGAPAGGYDLVCLPLRLVGADGAPARVLLRPLPAA